jgi:hypothetical protein
MLGGFEIESALLAEQGHEFQPAPGVDDFVQGGVNRGAQGCRAQDFGRLPEDIWIYLYGCLRHASMISRAS